MKPHTKNMEKLDTRSGHIENYIFLLYIEQEKFYMYSFATSGSLNSPSRD